MGKSLDLTNQRFGRLVAKDANKEQRSRGSILWTCACDCGGTCQKLAGDLRSGHVKSCGCLNVELRRLRPYEALYNNFVNVGPKRKGKIIENTISYEDFVEFIKIGVCFYCGSEVEWAKFNIVKNKASYKLDRVDSKLGYTKENCVVCCPTCNLMKLQLSSHDFINQAHKIAKHCLER
jgi:hypothetical protein